MRSYPSAPLLLRSLRPSARGERRPPPKCHSHTAPIHQTADDWRKVLVHVSLNVSRAPDFYTTHRVLSRGLVITQKDERVCQSAVASNYQRCIVLFLRERVTSFGNLHRCRQLVRELYIAKPSTQCQRQKPGLIQRMTQGLSALVTKFGPRLCPFLAWPLDIAPPA
jgi:hypothetical protein